MRLTRLILIAGMIAWHIGSCSTDIVQTTAPGSEALQDVTPPAGDVLSATPRPARGLPGWRIPVTWAGLNLHGRLVYTAGRRVQGRLLSSIEILDLQTGSVFTVFQAPPESWADFLSVAPDEKQVLITYMPPHGTDQFGQQGIYSLPLDGSTPPRLVYAPEIRSQDCYHVQWAKDGRSFIFAMVDLQTPPRSKGQRSLNYNLFRMAYPGGSLQETAESAYWPRFSADGTALVYVTVDEVTGADQLFTANADGGSPRQVQFSGAQAAPVIDAPLFLPGDNALLFSAASQPPASSVPALWGLFSGVMPASAHTTPSDWWSIPVGGGVPTQLTHIGAVGLYASLSPDRHFIASYSGQGLFVMGLDGSKLTTIYGDTGGLPGTVNWIP